MKNGKAFNAGVKQKKKSAAVAPEPVKAPAKTTPPPQPAAAASLASAVPRPQSVMPSQPPVIPRQPSAMPPPPPQAASPSARPAAAPPLAPAPARPVSRTGDQHQKRPVTIEAKIDVGFGNGLFLRGEGPGLSWNRGVPLVCVDSSTWKWSGEADEKLKVKLLLNDTVWCKGEDLVVAPGQTVAVAPAF